MDQNPIDLVSESTRNTILLELTETLRKQQEEIRGLYAKLEVSNRQIEVIATQGLDIRKIHPIDQIEEYLNYDKGYLQNLLATNESEYLKAIISRHHSLMDEKVRVMKDHQMDVNGDSVAKKIKDAVSFFQMHKTVTTFTPDDTAEYPKAVDELIDSMILLWNWKASSADLANFNEAITAGVLQYAVMHISKQSIEKAEKKPFVNPEIELEARKAAEDLKNKTELVDKDRLSKIEDTLSLLLTKLDQGSLPHVQEPLESVPSIEDDQKKKKR